ncbi:hypothetical protein ACFLX9_03555 [Chloroflexota bacterium]
MPNYYTVDDGIIVVEARLEGWQHIVPLWKKLIRKMPLFNGAPLTFIITVHPKDKRAGYSLYIERMLAENGKNPLVSERTIPSAPIPLSRELRFRLRAKAAALNPATYKVGILYELHHPTKGTPGRRLEPLVDFELGHRDRLRMWMLGMLIPLFIALAIFGATFIAQIYANQQSREPQEVIIITPTPISMPPTTGATNVAQH